MLDEDASSILVENLGLIGCVRSCTFLHYCVCVFEVTASDW